MGKKAEIVLDYTIKIKRGRECIGSRTYKECKDTFYYVEIDRGCGHKTYFAVPIKRNLASALRKALNEVKRHLWI